MPGADIAVIPNKAGPDGCANALVAVQAPECERDLAVQCGVKRTGRTELYARLSLWPDLLQVRP